MRRAISIVIVAALGSVLCLGALSSASDRVEVCHIPPSNPSNFHTIIVSENALPAHLAHGDYPASCDNYCEILCDDGNKCTIDACIEGTEICAEVHPPVDCDDSDACTADSCDELVGCQYDPVYCDDGDPCRDYRSCVDPLTGECVSAQMTCGIDFATCAEKNCDSLTGECVPGELPSPIPECLFLQVSGFEVQAIVHGQYCKIGNSLVWESATHRIAYGVTPDSWDIRRKEGAPGASRPGLCGPTGGPGMGPSECEDQLGLGWREWRGSTFGFIPVPAVFDCE